MAPRKWVKRLHFYKGIWVRQQNRSLLAWETEILGVEVLSSSSVETSDKLCPERLPLWSHSWVSSGEQPPTFREILLSLSHVPHSIDLIHFPAKQLVNTCTNETNYDRIKAWTAPFCKIKLLGLRMNSKKSLLCHSKGKWITCVVKHGHPGLLMLPPVRDLFAPGGVGEPAWQKSENGSENLGSIFQRAFRQHR